MNSPGPFPAVRMPGYFEINASNGAISFAGADYANPRDADQNNAYEVTIRAAESSGLHAEQVVRVAIEYPFDEANGDEFLDVGLVAWYPFDGNASDMSGNGNHGTVNGATLGIDRHGTEGKSYNFDGVNDWIEVLHNEQINFDSSSKFSLHLWVKILGSLFGYRKMAWFCFLSIRC